MSSFLVIIVSVLIHLIFSADKHCNIAFECVGQSIVESSPDFIYGKGHKSIYGSSSSIFTDYVSYCQGSFACAEISFIYTDHLFCQGSNSCGNVSDITANIVDGHGTSSLSHSILIANNVSCYGGFSCQHAIINDASIVRGYGSFSLYAATIVNPQDIYFFGYLSGYQATIICTISNTCNIHCTGNACYELKFNCSNNCNISSQNPTNLAYAFIDLLNFATTTQTNDDLCSTESNMAFGNNMEILTSEGNTFTVNYGGEGPVCCTGFQSCAEGTIYITSPTQESLICSGGYSCVTSWYTTVITTTGSVFCEGWQSCYRTLTEISASNVYCLGDQSCGLSNFLNTPLIYCFGYQSCVSTTITSGGSRGTDLSIYLLGYQAGKGMSLTCSEFNSCSIYCRGKESCENAIINCIGSCIVECDDNSRCPGGSGWTFSPTKFPTFEPTVSPSKLPTIQPTIQPTMDSSEEWWLAHESRKQEYEPVLKNMVEMYQFIIIAFVSFMILVVIIAIILTLNIQTNDYLRVGAVMVMIIGTIDVISDWFFIAKVHIENKIELNNTYEMITVIAMIFIIVPSVLSLFQMRNYSSKHWRHHDHLRPWLSNHSIFLFALSIVVGNAFNGVYFVNSSIYGLSIFDMGLTKRELNIFGTKRMYSIVVLENIPQIFFQMYYLTSLSSSTGIDVITSSSMVFSLISIIMSFVITKMANVAHYNKQHEIVCISMDITGDCIENKSSDCRMSKNVLQQLVAELLCVDKNTFEIIKPVYIQNGLALNIFIYRTQYDEMDMDIDHQQILIQANQQGKLSTLFQIGWGLKLSDKPQIANILSRKIQKMMSSATFSYMKNTDVIPLQNEIELANVTVDENDEDSLDGVKEFTVEDSYLKENEYSQVFETKPLGLLFGKKNYFGAQDKNNLYITAIDDFGDKNRENVVIGSRIIKLQDENVENIGYKKISKLFTDKYADTLPLKITFIGPNILHSNEKDEEKQLDLIFEEIINDSNIYCVVFEKKPLGLTFGKVKTDKQNLFVTAVVEGGVAEKANVIVGSKIIKFEDQEVEGLGFMKIFQIFTEKYSDKIPLKVTFGCDSK